MLADVGTSYLLALFWVLDKMGFRRERVIEQYPFLESLSA
jgi:hypothetical protein